MTLLEKIKAEIKSAGGRVALMEILMKESPDWFSHAQRMDLNQRLSKHRSARKRRAKEAKVKKTDYYWKPEDVEYLLRNYGRLRTGVIARIIGRSPESVHYKFKSCAPPELLNLVRQSGLYKNRKPNLPQLNK